MMPVQSEEEIDGLILFKNFIHPAFNLPPFFRLSFFLFLFAIFPPTQSQNDKFYCRLGYK